MTLSEALIWLFVAVFIAPVVVAVVGGTAIWVVLFIINGITEMFQW